MSTLKENRKFFNNSTTLEIVQLLSTEDLKEIVGVLKAEQAALIKSNETLTNGQEIRFNNDCLAELKKMITKANTAINMLNVHAKEKRIHEAKTHITYEQALAFYQEAEKTLAVPVFNKIKQKAFQRT